MKKPLLPFTLNRPLVLFDIEATGTSPRADRIVEICFLKVHPDGERTVHTYRINPGIPIPAETTEIHGITDEDVKDCPSFPELAPSFMELLEGCDLGGYNILRYDIPMLTEEFHRAKLVFDVTDRRMVDVQRIFHRREPRDLSAALSFYCNELHLDAHGAEADTTATLRVLEGQFRRYTDLPTDMDDLADYCNPRDPTWVDRYGKLKWHNKEVVLNFGKRKGEPLKHIVETDSGFINWMLRSDFPKDTRDILEDAIRGEWPTPPD